MKRGERRDGRKWRGRNTRRSFTVGWWGESGFTQGEDDNMSYGRTKLPYYTWRSQILIKDGVQCEQASQLSLHQLVLHFGPQRNIAKHTGRNAVEFGPDFHGALTQYHNWNVLNNHWIENQSVLGFHLMWSSVQVLTCKKRDDKLANITCSLLTPSLLAGRATNIKYIRKKRTYYIMFVLCVLERLSQSETCLLYFNWCDKHKIGNFFHIASLFALTPPFLNPLLKSPILCRNAVPCCFWIKVCVCTRAWASARGCPRMCAPGMSLSLYKGITGITGGRSFISRPETTAGQPLQSHAIRLLHCIGTIDGICCLAAACCHMRDPPTPSSPLPKPANVTALLSYITNT